MDSLKYKFILNPTAGKGKGQTAAALIMEQLSAQKYEFEIVQTTEAGHGIDLAKQAVRDGWPAIIAVGGDGTMGEVMNGIMTVGGHDCHFGFIPAGTGNDFARSLQIPLDMNEAIKTLLTAKTKRIDIGKEREGYFAIITGLGFPADVMAKANAYRGVLKGPAVITWSVLKTIHELRAEAIELILDGQKQEMPAKAVFVLNMPFTGGGLQIVPTARPDDGLLDICVIKNMSKADLFLTLPKAYKGKHVGHPDIAFFRCRQVTINTEHPRRKLFDGNVFGNAPLSAEILPEALSVLVPQDLTFSSDEK
ncbi:MAG: diacylglycerol kinase family lipid kinase [Bacillota bacterium]|nr:diacylglycerol kinase family lipid kinase [Bacillota bacterium]